MLGHHVNCSRRDAVSLTVPDWADVVHRMIRDEAATLPTAVRLRPDQGCTTTTCLHTHTDTHPFNDPFSWTTQVSWYQKGKTNLDSLKQETVSGSGISWAIYGSLHLAPCQYPTTQVFYMPFLPPNQQHQSTEDKKEHLFNGLFPGQPRTTRTTAAEPFNKARDDGV